MSERLADIPRVRETVLRAAQAARGEGDPYAMSHAWLFTGPPGAGRSHAAVAFAAALVCTNPEEIGCGRCAACQAVFKGAHTDVERIEPKELSISVETVRVIIGKASRLPTIGKWRVIIIDEADRFSTAAADAFLKTVEEPPASTVIILCAPSTDPEDFSPTLRSRCRHVYIPEPSESELVRILTREEGASEDVARLAAAASLRHIGRARRLVRDKDAREFRAQVINLAELVFHGDEVFKAVATLLKATDKEAVAAHESGDALEREKLEQALGVGARGKGAAKALRGAAASVKELEALQKKRGTRRTRDVLDLVLVDLAGIYRDALVLRTGATVGLTHPDYEGQAREIAQQVTPEGLVACLDAIAICRGSLDQNVTPVIAFNGMIGRIRQACNVK
ncbi:DNA polymerase-3 subunit delta' [Corynebacterium mycetoides]|uniref:DNA polymerase-3 subunit delta n=1 Tax=Corynebacterium mycetoides TaxID=38302 RepID=A0A1G9Q6S1_9CORY|nr:DNA polymerase-3 subunit delta' [Corynebacterium mycetoides]